MRVLIIYFSGSGNTEYGCKLIREGLRLNGVACDMVSVKEKPYAFIKEYDIIGFASPVYAFAPASVMVEFIRGIEKQAQKPAFIFLTYAGFSGNAGFTLYKQLTARGFRIFSSFDMIAEDSWTLIRKKGKTKYSEGHPTADEQQRVVEYGKTLLDDLNKIKEIRYRFTPFDIVAKLYNPNILKHWFKINVDMNKCIKCGSCEKICPTGRMDISKFPNPKGDCIGCYGCINVCPREAVDTWGTKGKDRYKGVRKQILE